METRQTTIPIIETQEVTVYLDEEQARQFVLFQQYYPIISPLLKAKVFEQMGATVTLHFDKHGALRTITRQDLLYDSNNVGLVRN